MEKKAIVALALSLLVLIGYQHIMSRMYPVQKMPLYSSESVQQPVNQAKSVDISAQNVQLSQEYVELAEKEKEFSFKNDLYTVIFSNIGGSIKSITLNTNAKSGLNIPFEIFKSTSPDQGILLFSPDKLGAYLNSTVYTVKSTDDGIIFSHVFADDIAVEKKIKFTNSLYRIDLDITFKNLKSGDTVRKYALISGIGAAAVKSDERYLEVSSNNADGKVTRFKKRGKPFEIEQISSPSWVMLKTRYISMIAHPAIPCTGSLAKQEYAGSLITGPIVKDFAIPANSSVLHSFSMYVGPSDLGLLKKADIGADSALTYGFFGGISQLLISLLKFYHVVFRNWGIAIIMLTLSVNILLFPLTRKSYKSMQEIQILQPKIEKLKAEHKGNPQKFQKELMELYKKYKVNPMGGCLPMLLQMPIFIALYQGLMNSLDLRGSSFLWIRDLSLPENLKIPFTAPLIGNTVNLIPLMILVAMFFQQKISNQLMAISQTEDQKQQQKFMMFMMPVMFGFLFYNFPSGLGLYWFANTVIMTIYQRIFTRMPKPEHLTAD